MLYGPLSEIRRRFSGNALLVRAESELPNLPGVISIERTNGTQRLNLAEGAQPQEILRTLVSCNVILDQFEVAVPTLDEIFIEASSIQA
jgi:ABC-2 type transport system ATP-binding protein